MTEIKETKYKRIKLLIIISIIVVLLVGGVIGYSYYKPVRMYNQAMQSFNSGEYDIALEQFEAMGDYGNSIEMIAKANKLIIEDKYKYATKLFQSNDYDNSLAMFQELGDYKDSNLLKNDVIYMKVHTLFHDGKYQECIDTSKALELDVDYINYEDFHKLIKQSKILIKYRGSWHSEFDKNDILTFELSEPFNVDFFLNRYVLNDDDVIEITNKDTVKKYYKFSDEIVEIKPKYTSSRNSKPPQISMTESEVRSSTWGKPNKINKTTNKYGVSEQWVYSGGRYVYLDDGIVTAIQE